MGAPEGANDGGRRGSAIFRELRDAIDDGRIAGARRLAEAGRPQDPDHLRLTDALIALRQHDGEAAAPPPSSSTATLVTSSSRRVRRSANRAAAPHVSCVSPRSIFLAADG